MFDPVRSMTMMQSAMVEGWLAMARHGIDCWCHCLAVQHEFLHHACQQRCHSEIPTGPSLTDGYGRRAHDIDPEHDV